MNVVGGGKEGDRFADDEEGVVDEGGHPPRGQNTVSPAPDLDSEALGFLREFLKMLIQTVSAEVRE